MNVTNSPAPLLEISVQQSSDPGSPWLVSAGSAGDVSGRSSVNAVTGSPEHSPNAQAIYNKLTSIFEPHITGQNRLDFQMLIEQRATRLNDLGETPQSIEAVLAKGQKLDRVAQAAVGTVRSVPFGIASRMLDTVPALTSFARTPAQIGYTAGLFSGAVDSYGGGGGVLKKATSDTQWLAAKPDDLEPVMARAAKDKQPGLGRVAVEVGAAFQTYSLRNVLRIGAAALSTHTLGNKGAAEVDSWLAATGSPVAGAAAYAALQHLNEKNHRVGPEYLLGRRDWEAQYMALKDTNPWTAPLANAGKRLAKVPLDMATDSLEAIRTLGNATDLIKSAGVLGGGFAGILAAKSAATEAATRHGLPEPAVAAIGQAVNTLASAPVFATWTTADVMTGAALDKAVETLQEQVPGLAGRTAGYVQLQATDLAGQAAGYVQRQAAALQERAAGLFGSEAPRPAETELTPDPPLNNAERNV